MSIILRPRVRPRARRFPLPARTLKRLVYPLLLALLAFAVFRDGFGHRFTNWDDSHYIVENPLIHGLSAGRVREAFTSFFLFNYNPLHLVSYMVDHELWGLRPGGFFFGSLVFHVLAGIFLYFFALRHLRSPAAAWLVAALFLVHPTRIESVAWLSERKDVLSGAFAAASILLYSRRLEPPAGAAGRARALACGAWALFLLSLLSKSQLVTLPAVLLFLDLSRGRALGPSLRTQAPFVALSMVFSAVTLRAHAGEASLGMSFPESLTGPLAALPRYLLHLVLPVSLSPYYDFERGEFDGALHVGAGAAVLGLLGAAFAAAWRKDRAYCLYIVWFLAFLAPVIGVFRIRILLADRYLYLASIGPALAVAHALTRRGRLPPAAAAAGLALAIACGALSAGYVKVFRDSESLWMRVLEVSPGSSMAHSNLGHELLGQGRLAEAASHYDADMARLPMYETSILGRAIIHAEEGEDGSARRLYGLALEKRPGSDRVRLQYADFLEKAGERAKAREILLGLGPGLGTGESFRKLSGLERALKLPADALRSARSAVELSPCDPRSWQVLGEASEGAGDSAAALGAYVEALRLSPDFLPAHAAVERLRAR